MLYTGKGDDGTTKLFGACPQRLSKSLPLIEALGSLDELNSFLGICKTRLTGLSRSKFDCYQIVHQTQEHLFVIQAELAGAEKTIAQRTVDDLGLLINAIEAELPPIKSFFIPGASELGALFDYARALSRRTERAVLKSEATVSDATKAYLNRISSLLYALVRLMNQQSGAREQAPTYPAER